MRLWPGCFNCNFFVERAEQWDLVVVFRCLRFVRGCCCFVSDEAGQLSRLTTCSGIVDCLAEAREGSLCSQSVA